MADGESLDRLTVVTVVLFFLASVTAAGAARGTRFAAALVVVTAGGGFVAEVVGLRTGIPFGSYEYADTLGPTLLGVPVVVPLAWTMMGYPAWLAAGVLTRSTLTRVLVAGWALASWDLFLDPQLVDAGHWRWLDVEHALPGVPDVPLSNYVGWLVVATLMAAALSRVPRALSDVDEPVPIALYLWTWASSVLAHAVFLDLPWSAVYGGVAMGLVAVPLAVVLRRRVAA